MTLDNLTRPSCTQQMLDVPRRTSDGSVRGRSDLPKYATLGPSFASSVGSRSRGAATSCFEVPSVSSPSRPEASSPSSSSISSPASPSAPTSWHGRSGTQYEDSDAATNGDGPYAAKRHHKSPRREARLTHSEPRPEGARHRPVSRAPGPRQRNRCGSGSQHPMQVVVNTLTPLTRPANVPRTSLAP